MRVLVVEDDPVLAEGISTALQQSGYLIEVATDGMAADQKLASTSYDALILDLGLPRLDGTEVLRNIRSRKDDLPVLVVTARDSVDARVHGLDLGADDYLVKPFELAELEARMRALIRRRHFGGQAQVVFGGLRYECSSRRFFVGEKSLDLSAREATILESLMKNVDRVVSKEELLDRICKEPDEIGVNAIEVYIHRIRKKLEPAKVGIKGIRGLGYLFEEIG